MSDQQPTGQLTSPDPAGFLLVACEPEPGAVRILSSRTVPIASRSVSVDTLPALQAAMDRFGQDVRLALETPRFLVRAYPTRTPGTLPGLSRSFRDRVLDGRTFLTGPTGEVAA